MRSRVYARLRLRTLDACRGAASFFILKLSIELIDGKLSVDYMTRREVDADAAAMTQTTIAGPGGHKIARTARLMLL